LSKCGPVQNPTALPLRRRGFLRFFRRSTGSGRSISSEEMVATPRARPRQLASDRNSKWPRLRLSRVPCACAECNRRADPSEAMPVILTIAEEYEARLRAPCGANESCHLNNQRQRLDVYGRISSGRVVDPSGPSRAAKVLVASSRSKCTQRLFQARTRSTNCYPGDITASMISDYRRTASR
jgi:hypothetical protein